MNSEQAPVRQKVAMTTTGESLPPDLLGGVYDDMLGRLLRGWAGLSLYVNRRRSGAPPDATMEVLLRERLRLALGEQADIGAIIERWLAPQAR